MRALVGFVLHVPREHFVRRNTNSCTHNCRVDDSDYTSWEYFATRLRRPLPFRARRAVRSKHIITEGAS